MNYFITIIFSAFLVLFWLIIITLCFWLFFLRYKRNNNDENNFLTDQVFVSSVKFYFLRNKFTEISFNPKPIFLERHTINMDLFLSFFIESDQEKIVYHLQNYKHKVKTKRKPKIPKTFNVNLKIGTFGQKYYFKMMGCFTKSVHTSKTYNVNYVLLVLSNLDKIVK